MVQITSSKSFGDLLRSLVGKARKDVLDSASYARLYSMNRYGLTPELQNINGSFILDLEAGKIYLDAAFQQNNFITLTYVSDGLGDNGNFDNVLVPKLAEDAVYSSILYNLSKVRSSAAGAAGLYKKEASAKMRNAKIRLSNMKVSEMSQVLRNKSKWIKH